MTDNSNQDICQTECVHEGVVNDVRERMYSNELLLDLAELFKVFSDHTRIRILHALSFSELCVCDLANALDMTSSAVSHQLRVLRSAKIVKFRKEGKNVFYSLDDKHIFSLMQAGIEHVQEG
ncbi:MAG: winged helix-turn-helix transcriptional regulator [Desulfobacteraceae bacterium]|nr:winged helix-turn-helix transcriptional regulator [Desulfobacteraceae bacterium]